MYLYWCLAELRFDEKYSNLGIESTKCFFFAPNHGKSPVDGHFGKISHQYELYTKTHEEGIHDTKQLCDMINTVFPKAHKIARNKWKDRKTKKPDNTPLAYQFDNPLEFKAIEFDINQWKGLSIAHSSKKQLQYSLTIPDVSSFGYFEGSDNYDEEKDEYYQDEYEDFHEDGKYHIIKDGCNIRLKLGNEIHKLTSNKSVQYNLRNRVYYNKSGHMLKIRLKDHPAAEDNSIFTMRVHYSCDIIPKPEMVKKNEKPLCSTKELRRKTLARKRQRSNCEPPRKKQRDSNHNNR